MKLGIVGLPNVGKSTLFNAITKAGAESANYPFCTIEPNIGVVNVPDPRINKLEELVKTEKELKEYKKEFEEKQKIVDQTVKIQASVLPKKELLEKVNSEIKVLNKENQENEENLKELNEVESEYKEKDKTVKELKKYADEYKKIELEIEKYKAEIENIENVETKYAAIERDNVSLTI